LIEGMTKMMNNESWFYWPVNIWTQFEFTIMELANVVLELIPESKSQIIFQSLPWDDPKQRKADNRLAKEKLGRKPTVGLREGLVKTIEYFKQLI
jgi:UDP-glucuronate decarboxylase